MQRSSLILTTLAALTIAFSAHAAAPKLVKKVPPEFPVEATRKDINAGSVTARVTIDPDGKVSNVEILDAAPKRVFDRAVTTALMDWRYEPSGEKQTSDIKLVFKNDDN